MPPFAAQNNKKSAFVQGEDSGWKRGGRSGPRYWQHGFQTVAPYRRQQEFSGPGLLFCGQMLGGPGMQRSDRTGFGFHQGEDILIYLPVNTRGFGLGL